MRESLPAATVPDVVPTAATAEFPRPRFVRIVAGTPSERLFDCAKHATVAVELRPRFVRAVEAETTSDRLLLFWQHAFIAVDCALETGREEISAFLLAPLAALSMMRTASVVKGVVLLGSAFSIIFAIN
jgi:hypothetical protein